MASTSSANLTASINQAIAAARENPQLREMIEQQLDTRKLAIKAAKTGGKAYNSRRRAKKAARKEIDATSTGDSSGAPASRGRRGGIFKFIMLGAIVALIGALANPGTREKLLDALFGAEEEFEYTSMTTTASVNGSA